MNYPGDFGMALQVLRVVRCMNQGDLAAAAHIRNSSLSDYEHGKKVPELATLLKLLDGMGCSLSTLEAAQGFVRILRGEPPAALSEKRLRDEVIAAAVRLAAGLLAIAAWPEDG